MIASMAVRRSAPAEVVADVAPLPWLAEAEADEGLDVEVPVELAEPLELADPLVYVRTLFSSK